MLLNASGTLLAALGAVSFGATVVIGRGLADDGLGPATALTFRFGVAALALLAVLAARGAPLVLPGPERRRALVLGGVGYTAQAMSFYLALERGSAAAVALLFYVYPAIVVVVEHLAGSERMTRRVIGALALSSAGTVVIVASGAKVDISGLGIVFALGAAVGFTIYLRAGRNLGRSGHPMTAAAWVSLGAAISCAVFGAATGSLEDPAPHLLALAGYGIATGAAFAFLFAAVVRIGPGRTAVVMTLEALFAIVFAYLFLDETLEVVQAVGGAAILGGASLIARSQPRVAATTSTSRSGKSAFGR